MRKLRDYLARAWLKFFKVSEHALDAPVISTMFNRLGSPGKPPPVSYRNFLRKIFHHEEVRNLLYCDMKFHPSAQYAFDISEDQLTGFKNVFLRHDVDHNPFVALKMAEVEAEEGVKSTYYMLMTDSPFAAYYWKEERAKALDALRKIHSLGHEIGLHYDFYGDYFAEGMDPAQNAKESINILRDSGIEIKGCASHGSGRMRSMLKKEGKENFPNEFVNYTIWKDVRKNTMDLRLNKKSLRIPMLSLPDYGLTYEAYFVRRNHYASDTGGTFWYNGFDPFQIREELMKPGEILTILIHPIWWRKFLG